MIRSNTILFFTVVFVVSLSLCTNVNGYEVSSASACKNPDTHPDAWNFYTKVDSFAGWTTNYYKKYGDCKESQYTSNNSQYIDGSDIHYHVGHGGDRWDWGNMKTLRAVIFDDSAMVPSEAKRIWGNNDLEWIGFRCCKLLNDSSRGYWANTMQGLHLFCGFKTNSYANDNFGKIWAERMAQQKQVYLAWFAAADETQQNGVEARVLAEHSDNWNDRLWGYGYVSSDNPVDNTYHYITHKVGSPPYLQVDWLTQMRVYNVIPYPVDEASIWNIGIAFGFTYGEPIDYSNQDYALLRRVNLPSPDPNDPNISVETLQVYYNSGRYSYINSGRFLKPLPGQTMPNPSTAYSIAQNFLINNGLYAPDAGSYSVDYSRLESAEIGNQTPIESHQITCAVSYAREIEADAGVLVTVAGSGARMKVYIDSFFDVCGSLGRWPSVTPGGTVTIISQQEAFERFTRYGEKIVIEPAIIDYTHADVNNATLGYYQAPPRTSQIQLIPIWILELNYYDGSELVTTANTFIPAANQFYPPIASIVSPDNGSEFESGQLIDFNSVPDSNFGTPPYTYEWSSDIDGVLSTNASFSGALGIACRTDGNSVEVAPHKITLKITDSQLRSSSESIEVTVKRYASDMNCDGTVNFYDFAVTAEQWLKP
ncbi:MAG: DUF6345 domain-containing protein [Sedimentisphaerales bacterium]